MPKKGGLTDSDEFVTLCTELGLNTCGTEMHMNSTHVSYLNRLFTKNGDGGSIQKGKIKKWKSWLKTIDFLFEFEVNGFKMWSWKSQF